VTHDGGGDDDEDDCIQVNETDTSDFEFLIL
jgi:hypothetical protein